MTRASALILLGVLVFLAPFSGLPYSLLNIVLPILGIIITALGIAYRKQDVAAKAKALEPQSPPDASHHEPSAIA